MNEVLFLTTLLLTLALTLITFRMGRQFLFGYLGAVGTLAVLVYPMMITIFGFPFALGEIFYATFFLSTDIIAEHEGKKKAHEVVWMVCLILILVGVILSMSSMFIPDPSDVIQPHVIGLLGLSTRVVIAGFIMYVIEQHFDVWFFSFLKNHTKGKHLWLRNNLSTGTTQLVDVLTFYPVAFYGVVDNLLHLMVAAYIFKLSMSVIDTPFMYLSYKVKK